MFLTSVGGLSCAKVALVCDVCLCARAYAVGVCEMQVVDVGEGEEGEVSFHKWNEPNSFHGAIKKKHVAVVINVALLQSSQATNDLDLNMDILIV